VAEWIAMPASGIADWMEAASHAHVTLRKEEMVTMFGHLSQTSRSPWPTRAFDEICYELDQARAHLLTSSLGFLPYGGADFEHLKECCFTALVLRIFDFRRSSFLNGCE
jgi:hypothetical protein